MKVISFLLLLIVLQISAVRIWARWTIQEADYPNQYEVLDTSKTSALKVTSACAMTLRDKAKANIALNVEKKSYGSCNVPDKGSIFRGRENQKKNEIELVIPESDDKARIENWQIIGTVDMTPSAPPAS